MPAVCSEEAFTRFEIRPRVYETICFGCHRILGYATNVSGLEILEKVHNCGGECGAIAISRANSRTPIRRDFGITKHPSVGSHPCRNSVPVHG
jgi:hypothetical protein